MLLTDREMFSSQFSVKKEELVLIVSKCQERTFSEEIDGLEAAGGVDTLMASLKTDSKNGITGSDEDIDSRAQAFGDNKPPEVLPKTFWELLNEALKDFTLRLLLFFSIMSMIFGLSLEKDHRETAWVEGFAILVAVGVVSCVTALNDYQKERQFKKLNSVADSRKMITVIRNGALKELHQSEVLVGDLVQVMEGMEIPADGLVLEASELTSDESAMTGETEPIKKAALLDCINRRNEVISEGTKNMMGAHELPSPILMSGTKILTGEGMFIVLVVGDSSCVGKINSLLRNDDSEVTPLQEKLEAIARDIGKFGLIAATLVFVILILRFIIDRVEEGSFDHSTHWIDLLRYFMISVTVIVVAIPEGLPLAVTLSLAYSVKKMLKDNNLVRKLQACETMGGANMICSDKTGTLTQNKMTLTSMWRDKILQIDSYSPIINLSDYVPPDQSELLLKLFAVNATANLKPVVKGSKTEIAILEFLERTGNSYQKIRSSVEIVAKFPFSSSRKRMSTVIKGSDKGELLLVKGASEIVLDCCQYYLNPKGETKFIDSSLRESIEEGITQMANQALRTLCIAFKDLKAGDDIKMKDSRGVFQIEKNDLVLFGILGIKDILREEVPSAVDSCKRAGIKVRMVTGDNKLTAAAIARECGIISPDSSKSIVMEGTEFIEAIGGVVCKIHRTEKCDCIRDRTIAKKEGKEFRIDTIANAQAFNEIFPFLDVMARSRPEDKYALVLGLCERGNVVAVTGDGTNDAPALKRADVGFAMGIAGTEVCREASDIVLLDDNFTSIVKAVMWGRNIYDSIRKFLQFQLTVNVVAVLCTLLGAAIIKQEVFTPIQMLWINLIMDSLASLALATETPTEKLLLRKPHKRNDYIVSKKMFKHVILQSFLQFIIISIMVFDGDNFLPEYVDSNDNTSNVIHKYNPIHLREGKKIVRSGRIYNYGTGYDYGKTAKTFPSRHFTYIFNTFVWLQIVNFINSRKIFDELNIFQGILQNNLFLFIVFIIIFLQFLMVSFTGVAFSCYTQENGIGGLTAAQWFICIAFSLLGIIWSLIIRLIPENICIELGSKEVDPTKSSSVLDFKKKGRATTIKANNMSLIKAGTMNMHNVRSSVRSFNK